MDLQALSSHLGYLSEKSAGIWLSVWALRYKAGWDYRLSGTGKAVRWGVVGLGYLLAAASPEPGAFRTVALLAGLCFLCWPNFAYRLTNMFVEWPEAQGRLISITDSDRGEVIAYSFDCEGETFGGNALHRRKRNGKPDQFSPGQYLSVRYDPLNPDRSKVIF
jgi:hypothetical protein